MPTPLAFFGSCSNILSLTGVSAGDLISPHECCLSYIRSGFGEQPTDMPPLKSRSLIEPIGCREEATMRIAAARDTLAS